MYIAVFRNAEKLFFEERKGIDIPKFQENTKSKWKVSG
jgi:hypothetical protein